MTVHRFVRVRRTLAKVLPWVVRVGLCPSHLYGRAVGRSDQSFRDALVRGDQRAAAAWLVREYANDVLSLCRAIVRDEALAEDLTQDAFQKALVALGSFRGDASAKTWLLTIARHRCVDHLRRDKRKPYDLGTTDSSGDDAIDDTPLAPELLLRRDAVARALGTLNESTRALIVLRFRHGLGYPELADAFGVEQGAMRMRISRALAKMRAALAAPCGRASAAALQDAYRKGTPSAPPKAKSAKPPVPMSPKPPGAPAPAAPAPAARAPAAPSFAAPSFESFGVVLARLDSEASSVLLAKLDALANALSDRETE